MKRFNSFTLTVAVALLVFATIADSGEATAAYIGGLNGVSLSSTFETDVHMDLAALGWSNVSGSARIFDSPVNQLGLLIGTTAFRWANYEVEYNTAVPIQPNVTYTLQIDMGYAAAFTGGNSTYRFQLGTLGTSGFSPLISSATGSAPYTGNLGDGFVSASAQQIFSSGDTVSGDILALRWAQTSSLGSPKSDYFGLGTVTLDAAPIPEPSTALLLGFGLVGLGIKTRRRRGASHSGDGRASS